MLFVKNKTEKSDLDELKKIAQHNEDNISKSLNIVLVLSAVAEFKEHCKMAERNLLLAALQKPIYGPLAAIRSLIVHSIDEIKSKEFLSEWKQIIDQIIELCFDVSKVASSIVNSSSPEGIFPAELVASLDFFKENFF